MSLDKTQALNAAKQHVLQRNVPAAVDVYRKIIDADPTDLTAINTLGDLYATDGRNQEAIVQYSRAASAYVKGGVTRKAIATLKKIIALDPEDVETAIELADMFAQAGLPSEARQHYLQIAEVLTRKGRRLEALNLHSKTVDLDPSNTSTRIKLGELYLREGMNDRAYESFMTAAEQLAAKSENRRALNAYNEALAIRPDSVEALAAARKVLTALGVPDPDKHLRVNGSQSVENADLTKRNSSKAPGSLSPSEPLDQAPSSDSFLIQEISKAEILVAYGQVNQAITMLRDVLIDKPDSIDVHVKLKDIYLRTGMMTEAARECVELERIHDSRGESERARDYAVRASRLTHLLEHPSGDLRQPPRKPVTKVEPRVASAPAEAVTAEPQLASAPAEAGTVEPRVTSAPDEAITVEPRVSRSPEEVVTVEPRVTSAPAEVVTVDPPKPRQARTLEAPAPQPIRMTISVIPEKPPAIELAQLARTTAPNPSTLQSSSVDLAPVAPLALERASSRETALALSARSSSNALAPALFATVTPVKTKRGRLAVAAVAAAVFAVLGVGAAIGGFIYDAHLDKEYQSLALAAPSLELPPPPLVASDDSPDAENESVTVVVTPAAQADTVPQKQSPEPQPIRNEPPSAPPPVTEAPKVATKPSPVLPRTAVGADNRGGPENGLPVGVPMSVPIGAANPAEPPPKAVRQSPGVVPGGALTKVDPVYPSAAREARQAGPVAVEVTINEQGNVTSARALSGPTLLRNAAVMAARAWKFRPSTLGGTPVATTTTIVFNFKL